MASVENFAVSLESNGSRPTKYPLVPAIDEIVIGEDCPYVIVTGLGATVTAIGRTVSDGHNVPLLPANRLPFPGL